MSVLARPDFHKGTAVDRARRLLGCEYVIFVGDDDSDEDVFKTRNRTFVLGIRIGSSRRTQARYHLPSQRDMDRFLLTLLRLRPRQTVTSFQVGCVRSPRP